jgi:hypothetical protein
MQERLDGLCVANHINGNSHFKRVHCFCWLGYTARKRLETAGLVLGQALALARRQRRVAFLTSLELTAADITDEGAALLARLPLLQKLGLNECVELSDVAVVGIVAAAAAPAKKKK